MTKTQQTSPRNLTLEYSKLIAAAFVVFIHVPFPGDTGSAITALARFAVPLFFAVSGYFSYQTPAGKLLKRFGHIVQLDILGTCAQILWACLQSALLGLPVADRLVGAIPTVSSLAKWLVLNVHPWAEHLWYLAALGSCYLLLWVYVKIFDSNPIRYGPLYVLGLCLGCLHLLLGEISGSLGLFFPSLLCQNALLFGLPMFMMGLFLRQYQEKIRKAFSLTVSKHLLLILVGIGMTLLEWKGLGSYNLYFGSVFTVAAILLFASCCPSCKLPVLAAHCGNLSTVIYIFHLIFHDFYITFLQWRFALLLGAAEEWLRPVLVLAISLTAAIMWELLKKLKAFPAPRSHK